MKAGTYKVVSLFAGFGFTKEGLEQVIVDLEVADGPHAGQALTWFGSFKSESSETRTIESLRHLGWRGDNIADLSTMVDPATRQTAEAVVEEEMYEGKPRAKVKWINGARQLGAAIRNPLSTAEVRAFAARKARAIATVDAKQAARLGITQTTGHNDDPGPQDEDF